MYSVTCMAFCKCKNIKYSCQKDEPTFYSHYKNVRTNIKCSWFECPHCNFSDLLYYKAVSCSECTLKLVMELENDQHVSPEANLSRFPFNIFNLSGFSTLLVTTCLLRGLFTQDFYHGTTTIYNTKTISSTVRATY